MWCWRRMLRISWFMKRSNISVLEEIQPKRRLLSHVQSQMMKYFGHIARRGGNSLEKVIMQGCVEGRRKPGRPRTRWIDQIKSMVGCPLHELYNLVQDRQRWCDVVAVASCQSWQDRTDRPIHIKALCTWPITQFVCQKYVTTMHTNIILCFYNYLVIQINIQRVNHWRASVFYLITDCLLSIPYISDEPFRIHLQCPY